jgi:hypothetical protein
MSNPRSLVSSSNASSEPSPASSSSPQSSIADRASFISLDWSHSSMPANIASPPLLLAEAAALRIGFLDGKKRRRHGPNAAAWWPYENAVTATQERHKDPRIRTSICATLHDAFCWLFFFSEHDGCGTLITFASANQRSQF